MAKPAALKAEGWHKADIVAAIKKKNSSLVAVSEDLGLTRSAASRALILPHARVNRAIAALIGVHESVLWPQWFDASGRRIGAGSRSSPPQRLSAHPAESAPAILRKDAA